MFPKLAVSFAAFLSLVNISIQYTNVTITSGRVARWFLVILPPNFDPWFPTPVILSYHGGVRNATQQMALDQIWNPVLNDFAITVYPQGINDSWYGVPLDTANDLLFTNDILNHLESEYFIDVTRVYATGKSDGAGFCNVLACDPVLSNRFAAFAPVSGAFYSKNTSACMPATVAITCNPGRAKISMLEFHGGKDTTIPYVGEGRKEECLPSIPHWAQSWAARDGLSLTNHTTDMKGTNDTFIYQFGSGLELGLVTQVFDKSIAHDWPSTVPNADNTVVGHVLASFNATPIILDYFKSYNLLLDIFL